MKLVDAYLSGILPEDGKTDFPSEREMLADTRADWTISLLYRLLYVPPNVVTHMNRVTLVLMYLIRLFPEETFTYQQKSHMVLAAQTHDLANIIKFREFSEELATEELIWRIVQEHVINVWGSVEKPGNEHLATSAMLETMKLPAGVLEIVSATDHHRLSTLSVLPQLLVWYADMRVSPSGVTTFKGRLKDLKTRYPRPTGTDEESLRKARGWDDMLHMNKVKGSGVARRFRVSVKELRRFVKKYEDMFPDNFTLADAIPIIFQEIFGFEE